MGTWTCSPRRRDDDTIAWYENDGSQRLHRSRIDLHRRRWRRSRSSRRTWTGTATSTCSRRRIDDDKIAWYENDGSQDFDRSSVISTTADGARSVFAADVDGDGDIDVLSASSERRQDRLVRERRQPESSPAADHLHAAPMAPARSLRRTWTATGTSTCSRRRPTTTRSPGTRTTAARTSAAAGDLHDAPTVPGRSSRRTWTATATRTCSRRRRMTTRSRGTRTTAARPSAPAGSSPPPRTVPARSSRRTWTATGTLDVLSASSNDDKIAWYEKRRQPGLHASG